MDYGLTRNAIDSLNDIFSHYGQIQAVILYGSRAIGNFREGSDIDLTLLGDNLDTALVHKITNDIDNRMLPWLFDISVFSQIQNPDLIDHINHVGIRIYVKKE